MAQKRASEQLALDVIAGRGQDEPHAAVTHSPMGPMERAGVALWSMVGMAVLAGIGIAAYSFLP